MATENLLMAAVARGGDRQELHERIRRHSHEATDALKAGAPLVHENPGAYQGAPSERPHANVQSVLRFKLGDVETGFREADRVFEHTFETQLAHHGYLEPYAGVEMVRSVVAEDEPVGPAGLAFLNGQLYLLTASGGWDSGDPSFHNGVFRVRDDGVLEQVARLVEGGDLAAGAEAGVDGQYAPAAQRRLQQQAAEVAGEDGDRVVLGPLGQVAADFPFQGRQQQPRQCVLKDRQEPVAVRMVG